MNSLIDKIIKQLQVKQKNWSPPIYDPPNLKPFPIEFDYLGRCLHRLGDNYEQMKIMDLVEPSFGYAILYCLIGYDPIELSQNLKKQISQKNHQEICDLLGINVLVVGQFDGEYSIYTTKNNNFSPKPFVILFHSYDDLYYPIISLEKKPDYVFYRKSNKILQQLLPESLE